MRKQPQPQGNRRLRWLRALLLALRSYRCPSSTPRSGGAAAGAAAARAAPHQLPPRLAYLVSGGAGDGPRIRRMLRALYHPRNFYLVGVAGEERADLEAFVRGEEAPGGTATCGSPRRGVGTGLGRGPTELAATLHAAAVMLREFDGWSWFINLSASDYPLMPQDGKLLAPSRWILMDCPPPLPPSLPPSQ